MTEITDDFVAKANAKASRGEAMTTAELAASYAYEIGWRDGRKDAPLPRVEAEELSRLRLRASLSGAMVATSSTGNPNPARRKAAFEVRFCGEGSAQKAGEVLDAIRAMLATPEGASHD